MRLSLKKVSIALILFSISVSSLAETVYVRALKCNLMESPNFKANVLSTLPKGASLEVSQKKGVWLEVTSAEGSGWVSKFLVTNKPVEQGQQNLIELNNLDVNNVRKRASVITTAAAARGLTARDGEKLNQETMPGQDFDALKLMESFRPTPEEVDAFIQSMAAKP